MESPSESEPKLQPLVGEAKRLAGLIPEWGDRTPFIFSQVKNRVVVVNPDIYIPLKLEEGKESPLGLFMIGMLKTESEKQQDIPEGFHPLEVWPVHRRTALLGRIIFRDNEGRLYRDVDVKGTGFLRIMRWPKILPIVTKIMVSEPGRKRDDGGRMGLLDLDDAWSDYQMTEEFLRAGIRTSRTLAIIELNELIVGKDIISLKQAVKKGIIDQNFHPVVEVRAFATQARIRDLASKLPHGSPVFSEQGRIVLLEDAKKLIDQEFGWKGSLSNEGYLNWFAKTLGFNVGLMHKNGWIHQFLSNQNITLDCRIVDLDSVEELTDEAKRTEDVDVAQRSLLDLAYIIKGKSIKLETSEQERFKGQFQENYDVAFPPKERELYFNSIIAS